MYTISLNNSGGTLETRTASTPDEAAKVAAAMIAEAGILYSGDSITIQGEEGDE